MTPVNIAAQGIIVDSQSGCVSETTVFTNVTTAASSKNNMFTTMPTGFFSMLSQCMKILSTYKIFLHSW